eukprot:6002255-Prymnesium_polylepis.1
MMSGREEPPSSEVSKQPSVQGTSSMSLPLPSEVISTTESTEGRATESTERRPTIKVERAEKFVQSKAGAEAVINAHGGAGRAPREQNGSAVANRQGR